MLSREAAVQILFRKVSTLDDSKEERLGIIELTDWYIFYCSSEKYLATQDKLNLILGCGYYAISKHSGEYRFSEALISEKGVQETLSKSR